MSVNVPPEDALFTEAEECWAGRDEAEESLRERRGEEGSKRLCCFEGRCVCGKEGRGACVCALRTRRSYKKFYCLARGEPHSQMDDPSEAVKSVKEDWGHEGHRKRCDDGKGLCLEQRSRSGCWLLESLWVSFLVRALLKTNSLCRDMKTCEPAARTPTSNGSPQPCPTSPQPV